MCTLTKWKLHASVNWRDYFIKMLVINEASAKWNKVLGVVSLRRERVNKLFWINTDIRKGDSRQSSMTSGSRACKYTVLTSMVSYRFNYNTNWTSSLPISTNFDEHYSCWVRLHIDSVHTCTHLYNLVYAYFKQILLIRYKKFEILGNVFKL